MLCTIIGEDYNSGTFNVEFNAGITRASLSVSIKEDKICEGNKNFTLSINPSSLPNKVSVGDHGQTTVTIVDNDGMWTIINVYTILVLEVKITFEI